MGDDRLPSAVRNLAEAVKSAGFDVSVALVLLSTAVFSGVCVRTVHAQDAGRPRPPMAIRGQSVDLRPDGLWSLPKPDGVPCSIGEPGCCRGDTISLPDAEVRCVEVIADAGRVQEAVAETEPVQEPPPRRRVPIAEPPPNGVTRDQILGVSIAAGIALALLIFTIRKSAAEKEETNLPNRPVTIPPDATEEAAHGTGIRIVDVLYPSENYRPRAWIRADDFSARWKHMLEMRERIAALVKCPASDINCEPNPHGAGCRAWIGPKGSTWPEVYAADDGLAVSWSMGGEIAALARLRIEIQRRRRANT